MGIYNCEKTLSEAIESILAQTFSDWQLVMCDDGSTDGTYNVASEYLLKYPEKIVLLQNNSNVGLNRTLNRCLKLCDGEYIARMDGDDISLPSRLEEEVQFLDLHTEYDIVSTPMIFYDETGDWGRSFSIEKPTKHDFIKHSPVHCHAPSMIRHSALLDIGGYTEDERTLRFEDVDLWYKLYAKDHIGYNLDKPLYKMRDGKEAAYRRGIKSRMNGVYVTYIGFKRFRFPWYMYIYVAVDLIKHLIKGLMPKKLYMRFHKKNERKW